MSLRMRWIWERSMICGSCCGSLRRVGTAILLITHHIADILPEMQRIVMMREGRIVADGAKNELLTAARLSELFGREIEMSERGGWWSAW